MSIVTAYSRSISNVFVRDSSMMPNTVPLVHLAKHQPKPFDVGDWGQFIDIDPTSQFGSRQTRMENLSHVQVYGNKVTQKKMDFDNSRSQYSNCDDNHYLNKDRGKHPVIYVIENVVAPTVRYITHMWTYRGETPGPISSESCLTLCTSVENLTSPYMGRIDEESQENIMLDKDSDTTWNRLRSARSTFMSIIEFQRLFPRPLYTMGKMKSHHVAAMSLVSMAIFVLCM